MHADVVALLAVQADDVQIHGLEEGLAQLMPRIHALAAECARAAAAVGQARDQAEGERVRRREVEERIANHRRLQEKNQSVLNTITNQREATAAMAQLDQVTKFIADEEHAMAMLNERIKELDGLTVEREAALRALEEKKAEAEASIAGEKARIEGELAGVRASRDGRAKAVPRGLLSRYDRIRSKRRVHALFPLRGPSCSHCDTMVPMQRRSEMVGSGATEVCEGCGVLLYAE